ncbi:MAG: hypothetical protein Q8K30_04450, partial [Candidatus Gracilibacteria bacterium]|nr:hypothetical protein [Candidatus Gracilibacteria bacterium]
LEYAKNSDNKFLYDTTYSGVNEFGVEKILEKYNDVTFQAYVLWNEWTDEKLIVVIKNNTNDKNILELIEFIQEKLNNWKDIKIMNLNNSSYEWQDILNSVESKFKTIPNVNQKIFY